MLDKVMRLIEADQEKLGTAVSEILKFESIRPQQPEPGDPLGPGLRGALDYVGRLAREFGLRFRTVDGVVGVVELGQGEESVGALLHLDVVPAGAGWEKPAFSGLIENGEIWGRGAWDDKGPSLSVLFAMKAIAQAGVPLRRQIRAIFGTDEESGVWSDIARYLEVERPPTMSFVPDASFGITIAEKGMANLAIQVSAGGTWDEPTAKLLSLQAGERVNMVPDYATAVLQPTADAQAYRQYLADRLEVFRLSRPGARIELSDTQAGFQLVAEGASAHGSTPHLGHSALLDLVDFLAAELLDDGAAANAVRLVSQIVGRDLNGERLGIFRKHDFGGATTVNVGLVNASAQEAAVRINVRIPQGMSVAEVERRVKASVGAWGRRAGVTVEAGVEGRSHEPLYVSPDTELVKGLKAAYERVIGEPCELLSMGGTTFAKSMPNAVAFGPKMPDEPDLAHCPNERIPVHVLVRNAKVYAAAFLELAG